MGWIEVGGLEFTPRERRISEIASLRQRLECRRHNRRILPLATGGECVYKQDIGRSDMLRPVESREQEDNGKTR